VVGDRRWSHLAIAVALVPFAVALGAREVVSAETSNVAVPARPGLVGAEGLEPPASSL
jgi:hypothetical protein